MSGVDGRKPSAGAKTFVKLKPRIRQIRAFALPEGKAADRAQRARGRLPRSTAAGDDTLRNRIEPMEEEGAVGQRSRRSPSPRRSPLQSRESSLAMKVATSNRGRHTSREEWAMSGNDARYDADSAVLVAAESRAPGARQDAMARLLRFSSLGSRSGAGAGGGGCRLRESVSSCALWQLRPVAASRGTW